MKVRRRKTKLNLLMNKTRDFVGIGELGMSVFKFLSISLFFAETLQIVC